MSGSFIPSSRTTFATSPSADPRRVERRTPHRVPCRVRLVDAETGKVRTVVGETVNLSDCGVAMNVSVDAPIGTWVETLVPAQDGDPMFICGRVRHVRRTMCANFELGVAITEKRPPVF